MAQIAKPSEELMAFIQQNTGSTYSWNTAAWQVVPQTTFTQSGTRYGVFSANGQSFKLPLADCPAAGCATSPIAWASTNAQDQVALQAYATAAGVEMTSFVSRTAGVVGSTATAVAATPGPQQPVAFGASVVSSGIGMAADAVEAYITQNPMKQLENAFYMYAIQRPIDITLPLAAPVTNEVIEAWKASGAKQEVTEWANQYWVEFRAKWSQE